MNKHATKHFKSTAHPIIKSFEPGEDWMWCYVDKVGFKWKQLDSMQINSFGESSTTRRKLASERRVVTILFSDVKGSTAMAEHLDPEDLISISMCEWG
jgi:hypothetical protein